MLPRGQLDGGLHLDFNHAAINDDFGASYKTRIITCKKQNRLRKLDRLAHSLHWNDRGQMIFCAFKLRRDNLYLSCDAQYGKEHAGSVQRRDQELSDPGLWRDVSA